MISLVGLLYIFTTLFIFFLIIIVLSSGRSRRTYYFSLGLLSLLGWVASLFLLYNYETEHLTLLGRANFVFGILLLPFVNLFVLNFEFSRQTKWEFFIIAESIIFSLITLLTNLVVQNETISDGNLITAYGAGYPLFIIHFLFYSILLIANLYKVSKSDAPDKVPLKILLISTIVSIGFGMIANILIPILFTSTSFISLEFYTFTQNISVLIAYLYGIPLAYVLLKYKFLDSRLLLGEVVYNFSLILFTCLYVAVSFSIVSFVFSKNRYLSYGFAFLLTVAFVSIYNYVQKLSNRGIREMIISPHYQIEKIHEDFKKGLDRVVDIQALVELLENEVFKIMNFQGYSIIIKKETKWMSFFGGSYKDNEEKVIEIANLFLKSTSEKGFTYRSIFLDAVEIASEKISSQEDFLTKMKEIGIEAVVPVLNQGKLFAVFLLGRKKPSTRYNSKDISFLEDLSASVGWALQRMSLYQELEQFNLSLQQKVNEQTQELQKKVQQLQEARRKERDMIDIMGHELRTPATIVKLNTELLEQFTNDVVNNKDKFTLYVKRIKTAVENEIKLINTLLSSAKLEGDKIELNLEEIEILEDIDMSVHGHEAMAHEKGLELINNSDPNTPNIYADHARVLEILNNLLDNAIKYTETGSVSVSTSYTDDTVSVSIKDTGKGIPKEALPSLGQKFYRVGNYLDNGEGKPDLVRPGGTGLGLYVAFSLAEKMNGRIEVESEVGKGSVFTFSLPRMNGQETEDENSKASKDMFERLGLRR